ncbi:uncharacterized protein BXZ73DRAFT_100648 [Epithele typhae]|uniref:uncharacterized protein n=1 Tax=Epithele typhae TaxID=378194 RepID=UPI00200721F7|nr:uncharacterized protein BXZ73DRAFT_100648 [Epithele typhae]KAH9934457.1 hypothetical protein BXZ73DRAFT_100648 [Epithele typhae]
MKELFSLNEDVLLLIIDCLLDKDVWLVALIVKYAYQLAIRRFFSTMKARISGDSALQAMEQALLAIPLLFHVPRVSYLRRLSISCGSASYRSFSTVFINFLPLLVNLERFEVNFDMEHFFAVCPQVAQALNSLTGLRTLGIIGVGKRVLRWLDSYAGVASVEYMGLSFRTGSWTETTDIAATAMPAIPPPPPLATILGRFRFLRSLRLSIKDVVGGFVSENRSRSLAIPAEETIPALRTIYIAFDIGSISALDLIPHCPNLSRLTYIVTGCPPLSQPTRAPWPLIKELHLSMFRRRCFATLQPMPPIGRVHRLRIDHCLFDYDLDHLQRFLALLRTTQPSVINASGAPRGWTSAPLAIDVKWMTAIQSACQVCLRSLDLTITPTAVFQPTEIVGSLTGLRLIHLGATLADRSSLGPGKLELRVEEARVRAARALPLLLVDALPTLRVLRVGGMVPMLDALAAEDADLHARVRAGALGSLFPTNFEEQFEARRNLRELAAVPMRDTRWWMVEHDGEKRRMVEVYSDVAERARAVVESEEFDPGSVSWDVFFAPRYVYQP